MAEKDPSVLASNDKACQLITAEHVTQALSKDKGPKAVLSSFKTVNFTAKGDNYACFVTSVEVAYTLEEESYCVTYVVKLNPCSTLEGAQAGAALLFLKEASFYEKIAPRLNEILKSLGLAELRIPRFYYASCEAKKEMIFMEDMRNKGFTMHDRKKSMDMDHVMLVLDELARLHAAGKIFVNKEGKEVFPELHLDKEFWDFHKDDKNLQGYMQMFPANVAKMIGPLGDYEKVVQTLHELAPLTYTRWLEQLLPVEPFSTICHGDCWNNNLLFRYEDGKPVEVCMLDLQLNRYTSAATDVRYFLSASLDADFRVRHTNQLLSTYFRKFSEYMEAGNAKVPFSEEAFCEEYRSKAMFGLLLGMMAIPTLLTEASDAVDYSQMNQEDIEEMTAKAEIDFLEKARSNPLMKSRMLGLIDEMIEEGVLPK